MSLLHQPHPSRSPLFSSPRLQSLLSSPPPPPSVELLCCADRELICLPHLSPPPRGPRVRRRRRAPVKRLLCLLLAASPPLRGCADSASLSLLSGALSTEPVSGRQGSAERRWGVRERVRARVCVRAPQSHHSPAGKRSARAGKAVRSHVLKQDSPASASRLDRQMKRVFMEPPTVYIRVHTSLQPPLPPSLSRACFLSVFLCIVCPNGCARACD